MFRFLCKFTRFSQDNEGIEVNHIDAFSCSSGAFPETKLTSPGIRAQCNQQVSSLFETAINGHLPLLGRSAKLEMVIRELITLSQLTNKEI